MVNIMIHSFNFAKIPHIIFGAGRINELYQIIPNYGKKLVIVIGGSSLIKSGKWEEISSNLENKSFNYEFIQIKNEPSPSVIDDAADQLFHIELGRLVQRRGRLIE